MIHGSIFHELVNGCFLGVMKKNRHERLLSLVVGLISWDFQQRPFFWKRFSINKWDGRTWGIAAAICALRRYDVDLWLDFVSVIVDRTMISVGLIKEEIFVVRVAWISIGFSLHIPRNISIITLLSLNAIITIVIITLLSQFLLSLHIILLTFISRLFSEKNAVHYRK